MPNMTIDQAIITLRSSPEHHQSVFDSYLNEDLAGAAKRFSESAEFREVLNLLGGVQGKAVLDLGAGTGIASFAFLGAGAAEVLAIEPDASDLVGRGAIERLCEGRCRVIDSFGESLPLPDGCVDIAYCRQVLHHTQGLNKVMSECFRILKPGGHLLACREHVVDDDEGLKVFLAAHMVHQLAGGENAYRLHEYESAIRAAGFARLRSLSEYRSVISAFPRFRSQDEVGQFSKQRLEAKLGMLGRFASYFPGARALVIWKASRHKIPGRMYTFHAIRTKE